MLGGMSSVRSIIRGPLKAKLVELIRFKGPLTVSDYMKIVLTNPESGFYMNKDVFGVKGHFTTSPEISQIFGEIIGVWILQEWRRFNCPKPLNLVEFGPGRGTLMTDITRTLQAFKQTDNNIRINFIELSPHLKEVQSKSLSPKLAEHARWHTHIEDMEDESEGFTAFIAHEFFDALPIHKFVRDPKSGSWRELLIDYDQNENLRFCISNTPSLSTHLLIPKDFAGEHIEVSPESVLTLERVAKRLNKSTKGCMLICDYGFEDEPDEVDSSQAQTLFQKPKSDRDTFRAFKNHQSWPPLQDPGEADLTADVDFGYLKRNIKDKATVFGPIDQKTFLMKCGLRERLEILLKNSDDEGRKELISGAQMMIEDMGTRYKFLSLFPKEASHLFESDPPAGFDNV